MGERTVTISSGGKTFNTTGWKVGWMCGPPELVTAVTTAKQFLTYVNAGPFQPAIAAGLRLPDTYFTGLASQLAAQRDVLCAGLEGAGFAVFRPQGTYFVTVDIRPLRPDGDGMAFCRSLPHECGVVAVPNQVFYADPATGRHLVRFSFAKRPEVLDDAVARLAKLARKGSVVKVAVVQHDIVWEDKEANFARLAPMVASAAATGARLVVLSETFSTGFSMRTDVIAEPEGGPVVAVPGGAGGGPRRVGVRLVPRGGRRRRAAAATRWCWPGPTARCTATARSTGSPTAARTARSTPGTSG